MLERTLAGEDHRHLRGGFVDGPDDFVVAEGAAGLRDGGHALRDAHVHAVAEGEEAVGDEHRTGEAALGLLGVRFDGGELFGGFRRLPSP